MAMPLHMDLICSYIQNDEGALLMLCRKLEPPFTKYRKGLFCCLILLSCQFY